MNIFSKVTWETLKKNRTRTIVTIIGIILSASMLMAMMTSIVSFQQYLLNSAIYQEGDWHVYLIEVPKEEKDGLLQDERVESGFFSQELGYADIGSTNEDKPYLYVMGGDTEFFKKMPMHLTAGRLPETPEEILLPEHLYENGGVRYEIGDTLTLELGERYWEKEKLNQYNPFWGPDEISEGEELRVREKKSYTVTGFYERPNFESYSAPGYTALTVWDDSRTDLLSGFFRMENPKEAFEYFESEAYAVTNNNDVLMYEGASKYSNFYTVMYSLSAILTGLIMFGSISLIYNAFSISVSERTKEFGLLSSIGATKRQIKKMVLKEAIYLSIVGIPLGILAGIAGMGVTFHFIGDKFYSISGAKEVSLELFVPPAAVLIAVVLSFVTVLISAWIPSRRANRLTAIDAIRQTGDVRIRGREVKTSGLVYRLFGLEGMIGAKNFKRSRRRYRATVFSLAMSVVLFIASSSFCTYLTDSIIGIFEKQDFDISYTWHDMDLRPDGTKLELSEVEKALGTTEGVTKYSSMKRVVGDIGVPYSQMPEETRNRLEETMVASDGQLPDTLNTEVKIYGVDEKTFREYLKENNISEEGFFDREAPQVVVSAKNQVFNVETERMEIMSLLKNEITELTVNMLDEEKWDAVDKESLSGEEYEKAIEECEYPLSLKIGAHADKLPFGLNAAYTYGIVVVCPMEIYDSVIKEESLNQLFFKATDHEIVFGNLKRAAVEHRLPTDSLYDVYAVNENDRDLVTIVKVMSYGFITLISLISLANVFNTISTNVLLHRREFAILRSVGTTQKGLRRMLDFECLLYGVKSLAFGIPLAFGVTYLIFRSINMGYDISFYLPWGAVAIAVGSVFLVVFATMLYAMEKVKNDNPIDALRSENL